jgi:ribonuclease BN (tRNA processing enzyme)
VIFSVIGSGTAVPSDRGSPCNHLLAGGLSIAFDLGSGAVRALWRRKIDIRDLDVVALSHFHPDHTADLVPLLFALRNPEFGHGSRLTLVGPVGLSDHLGALESVYGDWIRPPGLELTVRELRQGRMDLGELSLSAAPSGHTEESLAFRVQEGRKSVVCGGDAVACESLVRIAEGADLLVLECSFPEGHSCEGHLTPSEAGGVAARAGARRLVLTHFYPAADASDVLTPARRAFDGEILLARDGLKLEV